MTSRSDIPDRLIYTCNCGWIDKGHANSASPREFVGASSLWEQIDQESGRTTTWPFEGHRVTYQQDMYRRVLGVRLGVIQRSDFLVASGLDRDQKESVALGIFLEVSMEFEALQWWTGAPSSSFSEEDLVSNLLGFYSVVRPDLDLMSLCQPVSAQASLDVWDANGGLGKNREVTPNLYPCAECQGGGTFPQVLQSIVPAPKGETGGNLWRDWQARGFGR